MQRHSLQKLCLCIFRQQHSVINIIITGDLPAVMTVGYIEMGLFIYNSVERIFYHNAPVMRFDFIRIPGFDEGNPF